MHTGTMGRGRGKKLDEIYQLKSINRLQIRSDSRRGENEREINQSKLSGREKTIEKNLRILRKKCVYKLHCNMCECFFLISYLWKLVAI